MVRLKGQRRYFLSSFIWAESRRTRRSPPMIILVIISGSGSFNPLPLLQQHLCSRTHLEENVPSCWQFSFETQTIHLKGTLVKHSNHSGSQNLVPRWAVSVSPGGSLEMQLLRPSPRPAESETLGRSRSLFQQDLQVLLMCPEAWEPLPYFHRPLLGDCFPRGLLKPSPTSPAADDLTYSLEQNKTPVGEIADSPTSTFPHLLVPILEFSIFPPVFVKLPPCSCLWLVLPLPSSSCPLLPVQGHHSTNFSSLLSHFPSQQCYFPYIPVAYICPFLLYFHRLKYLSQLQNHDLPLPNISVEIF